MDLCFGAHVDGTLYIYYDTLVLHENACGFAYYRIV